MIEIIMIIFWGIAQMHDVPVSSSATNNGHPLL